MNGTYAAVKFSENTIKNLVQIQTQLGVPNKVPAQKLHSTVCYSRKHLPTFEQLGAINPPWESSINTYLLEVWDTEGGQNALVLKYICGPLTNRHVEINREYGATYDYPEYIPHITLSYDVGDWRPSNPVVQFKDNSKIEIVEEYSSELQLGWASPENLQEHLIEKNGFWILESMNSGRPLRSYGMERPSISKVIADELRESRYSMELFESNKEMSQRQIESSLKRDGLKYKKSNKMMTTTFKLDKGITISVDGSVIEYQVNGKVVETYENKLGIGAVIVMRQYKEINN